MNRLQRLAALLDVASAAAMSAADIVRRTSLAVDDLSERLAQIDATEEASR